MKNTQPQLKFFIDLAQAQAKIARVFDRSLGGLGLSDFTVLYHLSRAKDGRMRRIDLAHKVGLTASGVTRMLLPMEKIGLVKREASTEDARVSFVELAPGGKRRLDESMERAELLAEELLPKMKIEKGNDISELFSLLALGEIID